MSGDIRGGDEWGYKGGGGLHCMEIFKCYYLQVLECEGLV